MVAPAVSSACQGAAVAVDHLTPEQIPAFRAGVSRRGRDRNNPWRPPSEWLPAALFCGDCGLLTDDQPLDHAPHVHSVGIGGDVNEALFAELVETALLRPRPSPYPREKSGRSHDRAARLPQARSAGSRSPPTTSRSSWSRSPVSDRGTAGTGSGSRATGCRLRCQHRWHPIARPCLAQRIRIPDSGRRGPGSRPPSHSSAAVASCASTV